MRGKEKEWPARTTLLLPLLDLVLVRVREQRKKTCSFDRRGQHALILGVGSGDPARKNLSSVGDELAEKTKIFIVDRGDLVGGEVAYFPSGSASASAFVIHDGWSLSS